MEKTVEQILNEYYYEHHTWDKLVGDLNTVVNEARIQGFFTARRRILDALDHAVEGVGVLRSFELLSLRKYIKGMVVKADE